MKPKIFKMTLISCLLITALLVSGTAYAQDEELPDPGMTPDSPFYFFDKWGKNLGMFFTFGPEAKARKALEYAEERLAETQAMAAKNRVREMIQAANDYDGFMAMVNERAEEARRLGTSDNISERVALAISKHLSVLERIKEEAPEQAKEALERAREASMNGQANALRALAKNRLERALDISSAIIDKQIEKARTRVTDNATTENITANVNEALDYAIRIAELEDEMVAIAQEKGIDITAIQERLTQATANRLEVLAGVYEKAPEKARPAIENAIENSVRKYERAVERLAAPVSDNISANMTLKTGVQAEIQEKVQEMLSNLKPEKTEPAVSANKTRENKENTTQEKIWGSSN
jgi:hypothetical protein